MCVSSVTYDTWDIDFLHWDEEFYCFGGEVRGLSRVPEVTRDQDLKKFWYTYLELGIITLFQTWYVAALYFIDFDRVQKSSEVTGGESTETS